jgi:hypothetical protein
MMLSHLSQTSDAEFPVDQVEERRHDRTPLLITSLNAARRSFPAVFAALEKWLLLRGKLFLPNPLTQSVHTPVSDGGGVCRSRPPHLDAGRGQAGLPGQLSVTGRFCHTASSGPCVNRSTESLEIPKMEEAEMKLSIALSVLLITAFVGASTEKAGAVVYCQYVEYPAGCVVRPGVVLRPRPVVVAPVVRPEDRVVAPVDRPADRMRR